MRDFRSHSRVFDRVVSGTVSGSEASFPPGVSQLIVDVCKGQTISHSAVGLES